MQAKYRVEIEENAQKQICEHFIMKRLVNAWFLLGGNGGRKWAECVWCNCGQPASLHLDLITVNSLEIGQGIFIKSWEE